MPLDRRSQWRVYNFVEGPARLPAGRTRRFEWLSCQRRLKHQARKQNQSGVTDRFENGEAIVGIANIEQHNLRRKMRGESKEPQREDQSTAGDEAGGADEKDGGAVKQSKHRLGARSKQQSRGFNPDQRVVFAILMRIDRVVADHPSDRSGIK